MRISDWSSDVCSSDLLFCGRPLSRPLSARGRALADRAPGNAGDSRRALGGCGDLAVDAAQYPLAGRHAAAKRLSAPRHEARDFGNEKGGIDPCRAMIIMRARHMSKVKQRTAPITPGSTIPHTPRAFPAAPF